MAVVVSLVVVGVGVGLGVGVAVPSFRLRRGVAASLCPCPRGVVALGARSEGGARGARSE